MKAISRTPTRVPHNRRGAALIIAMICALLVTVILGSMLKITMTRAREARHHERALQSDWLAEAALERAQALLSAQPDYAGETWKIDAQTFGGPYSGTVTITVATIPEKPNARDVRVQADYPDETPYRIRKSKQVEILLTTGSSVDAEPAE